MLNRYRLSVPTKSAAATWAAPNSRFGLVLSTVKYLLRTEVHTFAFSVAANAILSSFPFVLLLMTIIRRVFHSTVMYETVLQLLRDFLPAGQEFKPHTPGCQCRFLCCRRLQPLDGGSDRSSFIHTGRASR